MLNATQIYADTTLQLGPRKRLTPPDPLVHHGRHFGRAVHAFCNAQTLITNGLVYIAQDDLESLSAIEQKEYTVFREFLHLVPGLEGHLMTSSEEEVVQIADLIQKGANGARADDTKGMKGAIVDWITPKGQSLNPHIPHKFFLYANFAYNLKDPWNGLLRSSILVSARFALTSAHVFSCTDLVTDSERFYNSILELLDEEDERDEVDQLLMWWNCQIFPLYAEVERIPSKNSALARIRQKRVEYKEREANITQ
ncbi:hypothetical protein BDN67DRAFT_992561 [Paxillus ammoniavirescens]|nr:hypothetical protein BDN67DRAFT_992561 [Paxillus ammoniavirescens]